MIANIRKDAAPAFGHWTPIESALPLDYKPADWEEDEFREYLVKINCGVVPTTLYFNGEFFFDINYNAYNEELTKVTHWMPMPNVPTVQFETAQMIWDEL